MVLPHATPLRRAMLRPDALPLSYATPLPTLLAHATLLPVQ